jgi:hypothetical protein
MVDGLVKQFKELRENLYQLDLKTTYYYEPSGIALIGLCLPACRTGRRRTLHLQSRISGILNHF